MPAASCQRASRQQQAAQAAGERYKTLSFSVPPCPSQPHKLFKGKIMMPVSSHCFAWHCTHVCLNTLRQVCRQRHVFQPAQVGFMGVWGGREVWQRRREEGEDKRAGDMRKKVHGRQGKRRGRGRVWCRRFTCLFILPALFSPTPRRHVIIKAARSMVHGSERPAQARRLPAQRKKNAMPPVRAVPTPCLFVVVCAHMSRVPAHA